MDNLSSPADILLHGMKHGWKLYRMPFSEGGHCYFIQQDGSKCTTYLGEIHELEHKGYVIALPRPNHDEPKEWVLTEAGMSGPT